MSPETSPGRFSDNLNKQLNERILHSHLQICNSLPQNYQISLIASKKHLGFCVFISCTRIYYIYILNKLIRTFLVTLFGRALWFTKLWILMFPKYSAAVLMVSMAPRLQIVHSCPHLLVSFFFYSNRTKVIPNFCLDLEPHNSMQY